jgi:hypothetical protein
LVAARSRSNGESERAQQISVRSTSRAACTTSASTSSAGLSGGSLTRRYYPAFPFSTTRFETRSTQTSGGTVESNFRIAWTLLGGMQRPSHARIEEARSGKFAVSTTNPSLSLLRDASSNPETAVLTSTGMGWFGTRLAGSFGLLFVAACAQVEIPTGCSTNFDCVAEQAGTGVALPCACEDTCAEDCRTLGCESDDNCNACEGVEGIVWICLADNIAC